MITKTEKKTTFTSQLEHKRERQNHSQLSGHRALKIQSHFCIEILSLGPLYFQPILYTYTPIKLLKLVSFLPFCSSNSLSREREIFFSFSLQKIWRKHNTPRIYAFSIRFPTRSSTTTTNTNIASPPPLLYYFVTHLKSISPKINESFIA